MKKVSNILWIDWGYKYIWFAYVNEWGNVVMPIWYLINDGNMFFNLWDILQRYNVKHIVIWYPSKQEDIQQEIDKFVVQVKMIAEQWVEIERVDEDYTSVEAGAITWEHQKNSSTDTLAAMTILERWVKLNWESRIEN